MSLYAEKREPAFDDGGIDNEPLRILKSEAANLCILKSRSAF